MEKQSAESSSLGDTTNDPGHVSIDIQQQQQHPPTLLATVQQNFNHQLRQLSQPARARRANKALKEFEALEQQEQKKQDTPNAARTSTSNMQGFTLGCPGSTTTFVIPYHLMLSIESYIGECIPIQVCAFGTDVATWGTDVRRPTYLPDDAFATHWERVTLGLHRRAPLESIQRFVNTTLPRPGSCRDTKCCIKHYSKDQARFYFADVRLSPTKFKRQAELQNNKAVLQLQWKYALSHYYNPRKGIAISTNKRGFYIVEKLQRKIIANGYKKMTEFHPSGEITKKRFSGGWEKVRKNILEVNSGTTSNNQPPSVFRRDNSPYNNDTYKLARKVINTQLNNCDLYEFPAHSLTTSRFGLRGPSGSTHAFVAGVWPSARTPPNEPHSPRYVFVRDIQSLSSFSCVSQQFHRFILTSPLWNEKQQINMQRYYQGRRSAIAVLEPLITELNQKKQVIAAATVLSNQWTKKEQAEDRVSFATMYCLPFCLLLVVFIPLAAYSEAKGRWRSSNITVVVSNTTNVTVATVATVFPGINNWSNAYSYDLLLVGLIVAGVIVVWMLLVAPACLLCPKCRCRKMMAYCWTLGPSKTWQAVQFASTSKDRTASGVAFVAGMVVFFSTFLLGPFMLLLRSFLWGAMTPEAQGNSTPDAYFYPVWPFFILAWVCVSGGFVMMWLQLQIDDVRWGLNLRMNIDGGVAVVLVLLYSAGLILYTMKVDHSTFTSEWSALTCTIPIFIGLGICFCFPFLRVTCTNILYDRDSLDWVGIACGSVCMALVPFALITMFIVQHDDGVNIELWVYFMIPSVILCCGFFSIIFGFMISGFGDS